MPGPDDEKRAGEELMRRPEIKKMLEEIKESLPPEPAHGYFCTCYACNLRRG